MMEQELSCMLFITVLLLIAIPIQLKYVAIATSPVTAMAIYNSRYTIAVLLLMVHKANCQSSVFHKEKISSQISVCEFVLVGIWFDYNQRICSISDSIDY